MSDGVLEHSPVLTTLFSVGVGIILGTFKDVFLDRRNQSRIATYAAIRIVCVLDVFADRCLDVAADEGEFVERDNGQVLRETTVKSRELPAFADDIDWKSLDPNLVYKTLSLPAELDQAKSAISFMFSELGNPPDYIEAFEERQLRYASLGMAALYLTDTIRRKYDLSARPQANAEWSPAARLPEIKARVERTRKNRERKLEEGARKRAEKDAEAEE